MQKIDFRNKDINKYLFKNEIRIAKKFFIIDFLKNQALCDDSIKFLNIFFLDRVKT